MNYSVFHPPPKKIKIKIVLYSRKKITLDKIHYLDLFLCIVYAWFLPLSKSWFANFIKYSSWSLQFEGCVYIISRVINNRKYYVELQNINQIFLFVYICHQT